MLAELGKVVLGPLIETWRFVRRIARDVEKGDDDLTPPACPATEGPVWRRRQCSLAAFHDGEHRFS